MGRPQTSRETYPTATLLTSNPTSNSCHCVKKRATNRLSFGTTIYFLSSTLLISFHSRIIFCGFPVRILLECVSSAYMLASVLQLKCCSSWKDAALRVNTNACRQWCRRVRSISSDWRDWGRPQNSAGAGYVHSKNADCWQHRHINLWTSKNISFIYLCY